MIAAVRKGAKVRSIIEISAVWVTKLFRRLLFFNMGECLLFILLLLGGCCVGR